MTEDQRKGWAAAETSVVVEPKPSVVLVKLADLVKSDKAVRESLAIWITEKRENNLAACSVVMSVIQNKIGDEGARAVLPALEDWFRDNRATATVSSFLESFDRAGDRQVGV